MHADIADWSCYWCTNPDATQLTVTNFFEDTRTNTFGYLGFTPNEIIIAFRGTEPASITNWITDLKFAKTTPYKNMPDVRVHEGFYDAYQAVEDQIQAAVANITHYYPNLPLVVTGHSLGAALSTLCGADLMVQFPYLNITVWNFGNPRVGNDGWSSYYSSLPIRTTWRVVNQRDIVPSVPYEWMGFYHEATEVWYQKDHSNYKVCNDSGEDPTCQDSLEVALSVPDHLTYLGYDVAIGELYLCP